MNEIFQPIVAGLDLTGHVGKFETDDGVVDKSLAKCLPLMCVFDGFLKTDTREADTLDDDADPFMIEVGHEHCKEVSDCAVDV